MFRSCINAVRLEDYSRCVVYDRPIFDPKADSDTFESIECSRDCPRYFPSGD